MNLRPQLFLSFGLAFLIAFVALPLSSVVSLAGHEPAHLHVEFGDHHSEETTSQDGHVGGHQNSDHNHDSLSRAPEHRLAFPFPIETTTHIAVSKGEGSST